MFDWTLNLELMRPSLYSVLSGACITYTTDTIAFQVGVLIEEPFPMLALDALCKQLHDGIKDVMVVQNSVHSRLVAKTTKDHRGSRCENNGWPSSKREEAKID